MASRILKLSLSLTLLLATLPATAASLNISNAWIKNLPPVVPMRAGYMLIENNNNIAYRIVGIQSEVFTAIDIHETVEKNGMMSMQPVSALTIEANTSVELAPGGMHLMMMRPKQVLKPGDRVSISLEFDDGSTQILQMTVRK